MKRIVFYILCVLALCQSSFAATKLAQKSLIVSTNALVIQSGKMGINVVTPSGTLEVRSITSNKVLLSLTTTGMGIATQSASQVLEISGNMTLRQGALYYTSTTMGQSNADWRLIYRDEPPTSGFYKDSPVGGTALISSEYAHTVGQTPCLYITPLAAGLNYIYKWYFGLPTHTYIKVIVEYLPFNNWSGSIAFLKVQGDGGIAWYNNSTQLEARKVFTSATPTALNFDYEANGQGDSCIVLEAQGYHKDGGVLLFIGCTTQLWFGVASVEIWVR